jgi:hypothetical protein
MVRAEQTGGTFGAVGGSDRQAHRRRCTCTHARTRSSSCSRDPCSFAVGGDIPSGTGIDHVPAARRPHTFLVAGDGPARLISLCFTGGFEEFFAAAGRPAGDEGLPPSEPPDVARLQQVGAEFGLQFVGPPLKPRDGEDR